MQRNHKTEEHKKLRKVYEEYRNLQDARWDSGTWVDVEPYQKGWYRHYVLRDDAKNRRDAREMQQVLNMINTRTYCRNEDFLQKNWKTGKMEPIPQRLQWLTEQKYEMLSEKHKSFFVKHQWIENRWVYGRKEKFVVMGYVFRDSFYLVLKKEPYIIVQHWIPDQELESRYGELRESMKRNNVWNKLNKAMDWSTGHNRGWGDDIPPKYRNIDGFEFDSEDGE